MTGLNALEDSGGSGRARLRATVVLVAPVLLLAGFLLEPYVDDRSDPVEQARAVAAGHDRYLWAELIVGAGLLTLMLAVVAIRFYLRQAGEDRWSFTAVPLLVFGAGAALFVTGAAAVGTWTTAQLGSGSEGISQFIDQAHRVGIPISGAGLIVLALGLLSLGLAVKRSGAMGSGAAWTVIAALIVSVLGGFIPTGWAGFILFGGLLIAFSVIGSHMWRDAGMKASQVTR